MCVLQLRLKDLLYFLFRFLIDKFVNEVYIYSWAEFVLEGGPDLVGLIALSDFFAHLSFKLF